MRNRKSRAYIVAGLAIFVIASLAGCKGEDPNLPHDSSLNTKTAPQTAAPGGPGKKGGMAPPPP